ncbi:MAG: MBL fold metallo-hydrolase [Clostridia bacterium]|nr:MBL fold metallo-hydrolase [Clostridia bacterium]
MKNELRIRWIGQGGYLLSDGETEICIDPYLSDVVNRVAGRARMVEAPFSPSALKSDAVICTHDHLDHVDIDAIPEMDKGIPFFAPSHAEKTLRACGVTRYTPFDEGEKITVGAFTVEAVYALHSVPAIGVLVHHKDITLYISGDTEYDEGLTRLKDRNIDVMIVCINGRLGNMNAEDAARLTRILAPRVGIPTHYGMFESNTEDPAAYTSKIDCGYILDYDREYIVKEILENV